MLFWLELLLSGDDDQCHGVSVQFGRYQRRWQHILDRLQVRRQLRLEFVSLVT